MKRLVKTENIEELIVLLESIHIENPNKYLFKNNYLLTKDIFLIAKMISLVFNKEKSYYNTKKILTENKYTNYAIMNKKGEI